MARRLYFPSGHFAAKLVACHAVALCGHAILERNHINLLALGLEFGGEFAHGRALATPPTTREQKVFVFGYLLDWCMLGDFWLWVLLPDIPTFFHPTYFLERDSQRWLV